MPWTRRQRRKNSPPSPTLLPSVGMAAGPQSPIFTAEPSSVAGHGGVKLSLAATGTTAATGGELKRVRSKGDLRSNMGTVVLKVGSSSLSTADGKFALSVICGLVEAIVSLRKKGYGVILVTSGAVSIGCQRMELKERPKDIITKQAIAAIGQSRLMRLYDDFFSLVDQPIAQVLLSRENLSREHHYQNALNTFTRLLELGVVPIVNENDTVAVQELKVGDNDTLSALVASLVRADWLFLLTDVPALYTADPSRDPKATRIGVVRSIAELKVQIGSVGDWGTGGMGTKIQAAKIATAAGVRTVITKSTKPELIGLIMDSGDDCEYGTQFLPQAKPLAGRKRWIAHGYVPSGKLRLDAGAVKAINEKKSLFGAGIVTVEDTFSAHDNVSLCDIDGREFARGLVNYSSEELNKIKGKPSREYEAILGYLGELEIIERHNLALLAEPSLATPSATATTATAPSTATATTVRTA